LVSQHELLAWKEKTIFFIATHSFQPILFFSSRPHPKRSHQLRYVLRNRSTGQLYLVILFTLYRKEDVNEDGTINPEALKATKKASGGEKDDADDDDSSASSSTDGKDNGDAANFDEEKAINEARRKLSGVDLDGDDKSKQQPQPQGASNGNDDDVD